MMEEIDEFDLQVRERLPAISKTSAIVSEGMIPKTLEQCILFYVFRVNDDLPLFRVPYNDEIVCRRIGRDGGRGRRKRNFCGR